MSYYFAEGSKFYFSKTFGAAKSVSAASNASPAVLTSVGHLLTDNQEVLFTSGWEDGTDSVFRVDQLTADTFSLLGLDTTDTNFYPAGSGIGDVKLVSNWVEIPQILDAQPNGGDARMTTISPLAKRNDIAVPTGFNAMSINLTLGHDPADANYQQMVAISRTLQKVAFKVVIAGGGVGYGYGHLNVSEMPRLQRGQANQVNCAFGFIGRFISY